MIKKHFKILSIFLSFMLCFSAFPVMASEQDEPAEAAYGEAITITMPVHYRQSDSRWASDIMLSCGDTIGQSGCAITSFAMIVNFYGSTDDPGDVNTRLGNNACPIQYSTAGSLYGLTTQTLCYNDSTISKDSAINLMKPHIFQNRPILVGMKKGSSTHFVVATGYVDMQELGTSDPYIPILDPSTYYNKTSLNQYYADGWAVHRLYVYY